MNRIKEVLEEKNFNVVNLYATNKVQFLYLFYIK